MHCIVSCHVNRMNVHTLKLLVCSQSQHLRETSLFYDTFRSSPFCRLGTTSPVFCYTLNFLSLTEVCKLFGQLGHTMKSSGKPLIVGIGHGLASLLTFQDNINSCRVW
jgi:hypothetical protein